MNQTRFDEQEVPPDALHLFSPFTSYVFGPHEMKIYLDLWKVYELFSSLHPHLCTIILHIHVNPSILPVGM